MKAFFFLFLVSGTALADDTAMRACRSVPDSAARLTCYDRIELSATPAALAAPALTPQQAFGLAPAAMAVQVPAKIDAIESSIVGPFAGWGPNTRFKLANGQVWRVIDGSEATLTPTTNAHVTIKRNFIGTIFLQIEGTNNSPKVRRVE